MLNTDETLCIQLASVADALAAADACTQELLAKMQQWEREEQQQQAQQHAASVLHALHARQAAMLAFVA